MKLLWTKSSNLADLLIAAATGQDCAHFAILFEVNSSGVVFESNLLGTHPAFFKTWMKKRKIIHSIDVDVTIAEEDEIWCKWVEQFDGQGYDFLGALYTGLMVLRERIFKTPRPLKTAWSAKDKFYCDEIYQLVSGMPGFPAISDSSNGMDTPHDVFEKVSAK